MESAEEENMPRHVRRTWQFLLFQRARESKSNRLVKDLCFAFLKGQRKQIHLLSVQIDFLDMASSRMVCVRSD